MKKIFTLFLTLLLSLILVSCSNNKVVDYYQIGFETNGGTTIENVVLEAGAKLVMPEYPTKEGYVFGGWYKDPKLTEKFEIPEKMPKESFWLFADWHIQITFDSQGGSAVDPISARPGSIIKELPQPTYDSNLFQGWYLDEECTERIGLVIPSANTKLYAKWQAVDKETALDITDSIKINGSNCYKMEKLPEGYKMTALAGKGTWDYFYFTLDFDVKAYQTIQFELEGKADAKYMTKLEGGGAVNIEVTRTLSGKSEIVNWTVSADNLTSKGGQKLIIFLNPNVAGASEDPEWILIKSVKLFRHVDIGADKEEVIFFETNGGSVVAPIYAKKDESINSPTNPTKPGYVFDGWYVDSGCTQKFIFDKMPVGPTTVYAKWNPAASITIKYNTAGAGSIADLQTTSGSLVGVLPTLSLEGKMFLGWYKDNQFTKKFTDSTYTESMTLYARFIDPRTDLNNDTKIDFISGWTENEAGSMPITYENNQLKITTTEAKGTWTYIKNTLSTVGKNHCILKLVVSGTNDRTIKVKFTVEGGVWETANPEIKLTTTEQTLYFMVPKAVVSNSEALIFVDGGKTGTQVSGTEVTIKEIALYAAIGDIAPDDETGKEDGEYADYEELKWQPVIGYWFSQDAGEKGYTINTSQKIYISTTVRFTKDDIPVGSKIVIKEGYQYRPDGWNTETANTTGVRPNETKETVVTVDEAWWGNYIYRAFNISKVGKPQVTEADFADFLEAFKIYVPKTSEDIYADYEELKWQPVIGYWFSQDAGEKGYTINTSQKIYISTTVRFTKDDIPVGSKIVIKEGYQYRPDGWNTETANTTGVRPNETKETVVTVDEAWWGNYIYRAFNISKVGKPQVTEADFADFLEAFKIYVPKTSKE